MTIGSTRSNTTPSTRARRHLVLSDQDRQEMTRMISAIKGAQEGDAPDTLVDDILIELASMPGADKPELLRPLLKILPAAIVASLPEILRAEGATAKTSVLSYVGKDVMFRMATAAAFGSAILDLTDLGCDVARQLRHRK